MGEKFNDLYEEIFRPMLDEEAFEKQICEYLGRVSIVKDH